MTLTPPIQLWRSGLPPGVYEANPARTGVALARLDRAAFIGLAQRGPLHTPVDVADWSDFQRLFGGAPPGLLLPQAVRLFFANGGRRCLVVRCLNHQASRTRLLTLPALEADPPFPGGQPLPLLAARNPGAWASGLRLRLSLQQRPAPLRRLSPTTTTLLCSEGTLQEGDSLRLLQPRADAVSGAPAPSPQLVRVAGLEPAAAGGGVERGDRIVTLDPVPAGSLLAPELLKEARRLELTLEIWLDGRLVERWAGAALHPEHPRFLPRLLGRRAASEAFRPARSSSGDSESPASEVDRLWGGPEEPWGSEVVRPSARLVERSLRPTAELLERGEVWDRPLGDPQQALWDETWRQQADPDGAELFGREHGFEATGPAPSSDLDDRWLVFADRPGPFEPGGGLERWEDTHPLEPAALIVMPDLLHPHALDPLQPPPAPPPPARCFATSCEPPAADPSTAVRTFPRLGYDAADLLAAQQRLVQACEQRQQGIALLDLPLRRVAGRDVPLREAERAAWLAGLRSDRAAITTPWLRSDDQGLAVTLGPAGAAAGLIARSEREWGVWRAPANLTVQGVFAPAERVGEDQAGALHEQRINAIRPTPAGLTLLGSRTTSADPSWTHLSVRRLIDWLKLQIAAELAWAPFEPNGPALWDAMAGTARRRLRQVFDAGGLAGATEADSFFVRCDASTTTALERDAGRAVLLVGVAPAVPAEFLVVQLVRRGGEDPGLEVR